MHVPVIDKQKEREKLAFMAGVSFGVTGGARKVLMEAIDACAEKKTAWGCVQALAEIYDQQKIA